MRQSLLDYRPVLDYLSERLLCSVDGSGRRVALTFDDGPSPLNTPKLLRLLAAKGVSATFFSVGRRVHRYRSLARDIHAQGHELGNHGHRHVPLTLLPPPLLRREITQAGDAIAEITGAQPAFFRPPMGWFSQTVLTTLRRLRYLPVIGNIHPRDSNRPGTDRIVDHVLARVVPGSIIILHDGGWRASVDRSQTIEAVDRIIDGLGSRGYSFATLGEMVQTGNGPR